MAIKIPNPFRAVWGYLRGDDLKAADERAIAAHAALVRGAAREGSAPLAPAEGSVAARPAT
jgi:hypothetical protein